LPLPVPVSPPTFEIEGRTVRGEVAAWEIIGNEVERADGVVERTQSGVLRDFPSARLTLRTRRRRGSPVVRFRYEPFIRALRAKRPNVPIVMAERCDVYCRPQNSQDKFIRKLYEKLIAEGWTNLVYLPKDKMYTGDLEGTVDGCHPNDWGMMSMGKAFSAGVAQALHLPAPRDN
jgi:hypothetical protein